MLRVSSLYSRTSTGPNRAGRSEALQSAERYPFRLLLASVGFVPAHAVPPPRGGSGGLRPDKSMKQMQAAAVAGLITLYSLSSTGEAGRAYFYQ